MSLVNREMLVEGGVLKTHRLFQFARMAKKIINRNIFFTSLIAVKILEF